MTRLKQHYDYVIIGAGIVGVAVAHQLTLQFPRASILLADKEQRIASHQTGRNSGVIHAGVYYEPGSLKARYCRKGLEDTLQLCRQYNLPYQQCGKIVVATNEQESERLDTLFSRCQLNELQPQRLDRQGIRALEPNITGLEGVSVQHTGITDFRRVSDCLLALAKERGTLTLCLGQRVSELVSDGDSITLTLTQEHHTQSVKAGYLIACAGVQSDTLVRMQGCEPDFRIIPFKGEYFRLGSKFDAISQRLIYPVPDPAMPFLGVHLTRMIGGYTTVGPNAVLAGGKEAYQCRLSNMNELIESLRYPGFWRCMWRYRGGVLHELLTSFSRHYYAKQVQRYCPMVSAEDFLPYRSGIRAQAMDINGQLLQDFKFVQTPNALHVVNAPSPAATAAQPIARAIVAKITGQPQVD